MAVAPSEAADWQIGRDSTVAERLDHATDGESVVQNNGAVTGRSRERRRDPVAEHDPYEAFSSISSALALSRILKNEVGLRPLAVD